MGTYAPENKAAPQELTLWFELSGLLTLIFQQNLHISSSLRSLIKEKNVNILLISTELYKDKKF